MMKGPANKIAYFLVCDDIRREDTGKEILIGVYGDKIILHREPPVVLPKLFFRIAWRPQQIGLLPIRYELYGPDNHIVLEGNAEFDIREATLSAVNIPMAPAQLFLGKYVMKIGFGGAKPKAVGEFEVARPERE